MKVKMKDTSNSYTLSLSSIVMFSDGMMVLEVTGVFGNRFFNVSNRKACVLELI
jgi:hypothetical protein